MEHKPKIVTISLPEYTLGKRPDYKLIGAKIDKAIEDNFNGIFLDRALSVTDHPQFSLEQLVNIVEKTGTDKYDPERKGVCHKEFEPYCADLQAGSIEIRKGKLTKLYGAELIKLFYENVLLDRGYRLRIDLILLYDPKQMIQATKIDSTKPGVSPHLEKCLWRFRNPSEKPKALLGIIKILR